MTTVPVGALGPAKFTFWAKSGLTLKTTSEFVPGPLKANDCSMWKSGRVTEFRPKLY